MRRWLALLLAISSPVWAGQRSFTMGGEAFDEADIVDARAQPDISGKATILLTFSDNARARFATLTRISVEKELPVILDGKLLMAPIVREPVEGGTVTIAGDFTLADAEALAKLISGKDPLPDSLDE